MDAGTNAGRSPPFAPARLMHRGEVPPRFPEFRRYWPIYGCSKYYHRWPTMINFGAIHGNESANFI